MPFRRRQCRLCTGGEAKEKESGSPLPQASVLGRGALLSLPFLEHGGEVWGAACGRPAFTQLQLTPHKCRKWIEKVSQEWEHLHLKVKNC